MYYLIKTILKQIIFPSFSIFVFMLFTSFTSLNNIDNDSVETLSIESDTPFPINGKIKVYGVKGGHKQVVGEITYSATIELKETDRDTYSIVTVKLNNHCKYDVSGYVYGICNGQRTNFSKFEIVADNYWQETKILSGKIDNVKIDVLILDLGIL